MQTRKRANAGSLFALLGLCGRLRTAEIIRAMLALRGLLAIGYLVGTVALAFVLWFSGIYGHEEVDGSGSAWYGDVDAWQWDAILFVGFAGLIVGLLAFVRRSLAALALQAVLTGAGVAFVLQADVVSREQLVLGWLATFATGAGFMRARR